MSLPLKTFYKIDEAASLLRSLYPQRLDIDDSYLFQLGIKGFIRLGIFKDLSHQKCGRANGTLNFEHYEGTENPEMLIKHLMSVGYCLSALEQDGAILILNDSSIKDLYLKNEHPISDIYFDNIFSLESSECCIPDEMLKDLFLFEYADNLNYSNLYETIFYSKSTNSIHYIFNEEDNNCYMPSLDHPIQDWVCAFWFNRFAASYDDEEKFSNRIVKKDECLILGEDLQLLLDGKHREPIEEVRRIKEPVTLINKDQHKLHPKRANSINQIIYALAKMADLDLSQHQSAYTQLEAFCSVNGIKIPEKDTSGNLFKEAYLKASQSKF